MSITQERKTALINEYATKPGDTGSPEVQVAILTDRIKTLTEHFKINKKDFSIEDIKVEEIVKISSQLLNSKS